MSNTTYNATFTPASVPAAAESFGASLLKATPLYLFASAVKTALQTPRR